MTINLTKKNLLNLEQFIKLLKPISIGCAGLAIASLAIYPLISNKYVEKVEEKFVAFPSVLYTIILGEKGDEVVLNFPNQSSELHLKNVRTEEHNCLLNGGGISCTLTEAYQLKMGTVEDGQKPTSETEMKRHFLEIPDIEISQEAMDNIIVCGGVILGLLLINNSKNK
ncbi:MAG: hypothetical protein SWX82_25625 [Cyanobacteriota bacterium]|nr:hypothetical protein [Cyanobacteriota bacterium]